MQNERKGNKIKSIFLYLLSFSVFLAFLPIDDGGYFGLLVCVLQIVLIVVFYYAFNNSRNLYISTAFLIASNIIFTVIVSTIMYSKMNEVQIIKPNQTMDMLGIVMVQASFAVIEILSVIFSANVLIIGIITIAIRVYKDRKRVKKDEE